MRRWSLLFVAALISAAAGYAADSSFHPVKVMRPASVASSARSTAGNSAAGSSGPIYNAVDFTELVAANGQLFAVDPQGAVTCEEAPVNRHTLQIEVASAEECPYQGLQPQPSTAGPTEQVTAALSYDQALAHGPNSFDEQVRLVVRHPDGHTSEGPVVMTYDGEVNDYKLAETYGAGILWLYDCDTSSGPLLVEASDRTGAVVATVPMPNICRPSVSADADGFYLKPSEENSGTSPSAVYYVAVGSRQPVSVLRLSTGSDWTAIIGSTLWIELKQPGGGCLGCADDELVRIVGSTSTTVLSGAEVNGWAPAPLIAGGSLFVVRSQQPAKPSVSGQELVRIDIEDGASKVAGSLRASEVGEYEYEPSLALINGHIYALEGGVISALGAP
jgi:hypothetical protein